MLDFFKDKKILITGNTGFKGSWLTFIMSKLKADVYGFALEPEKISNYNLLKLYGDIDQEYSDIRNLEVLQKTFDRVKPDIVFHLAAQALVKKSYANPVETFETNINGSVNILNCVLKSKSVKSLVYITSDKCYENKEWVWGYREIDELGGKDPYSASKACAEIVFSSYLRSFEFSKQNKGIASARAGNVIGGGDFSDNRLVPDCIRAVETKKDLVIRNPNSTRPWQHVLEPLSGYIKLSKFLYNDPKYSGAWNFGPQASKLGSVQEIATGILKYFDKTNITFDNNDNSHFESNLLQLNCEKANTLLGWYPKWNINETIDQTATWYSNYLNRNNLREITSNQINQYFGL